MMKDLIRSQKKINLFHTPGEPLNLDRVLVVEDDSDFCSVLKDYLESVPFETTAVSNGLQALQEVLVRDFDAIICDMMMPCLAGDLFYLAVERTKPQLCRRFVFITGHSRNPKVDYFIKEIGGTMLAKPFHMSALRDAVEFILKSRALAPNASQKSDWITERTHR
jgi:two-component system cell cycle sensor histidine kinase/response regulator CckA